MQSQVARYKNQVKELEGREDELMKEKRQQAKEVSVSLALYVYYTLCKGDN